MSKSETAHRQRASRPLLAFLGYLEEIEGAVLNRDSLRVTALLRKRTATHLPRAVREELLLISRQPRDSLRAPVQFLRFQHRMTQLAKSERRLPTAQTELRLEPPVAGSIRRSLVDDRRSAACDPSDDTRGDQAP